MATRNSRMTIGSNIGYTRWYDRIPELSQAVRQMEKLPLARQQWLAHAIIDLMPMHQVSQRTEGLKKLGTEKVKGLLKAKVKRRWYDNDPLVHQAFNHLYLMDDQLRYEMAIKMLICCKALDTVKLSDYSPNAGLNLVRTIFEKPLSYLQTKTQFVFIQPEPKPLLSQISFALESIPIEAADSSSSTEEETMSTPASSNSIKTSTNSDMKVVRLKQISDVKMG